MTFIEFAHDVAKNNLVRASSGNISARTDFNTLLITISGSWLEKLTYDDMIECSMQDDENESTSRQSGHLIQSIKSKPSSEIEMHRHILNSRKDINVVLHCQSQYATLLTCQNGFEDIDISNLSVIPEIPYYIKQLGCIGYYKPGSIELAKAVGASAYMGNNVILLKNHGQVIVGRDFNETLQRAIFFELACSIVFSSLQCDICTLSSKDIRELQSSII
jgi:ribulose-5-phosphate 4-epimerase/fuculose-1-phosphate aldolase